MNTLKEEIEKLTELIYESGSKNDRSMFHGLKNQLLSLFQSKVEEIIGFDDKLESPESNSEWNELRSEQRNRLKEMLK